MSTRASIWDVLEHPRPRKPLRPSKKDNSPDGIIGEWADGSDGPDLSHLAPDDTPVGPRVISVDFGHEYSGEEMWRWLKFAMLHDSTNAPLNSRQRAEIESLTYVDYDRANHKLILKFPPDKTRINPVKEGEVQGRLYQAVFANEFGNEIERFSFVPNSSGLTAHSENWQDYFRTKAQLSQRELTYAIDRLVPEEAITGVGGLSGHAKTWVLMSMAKAIHQGSKLWGFFTTQKHPVLYLNPETGDSSIRHRMNLMRIPNDDGFRVRTMSQGQTLSLSCDVMRRAAKGRVVFLDTLPRFTEGGDEQQAKDMKVLNEALFGLLQAGAVAVVFAHHSPKASRNEADMDLENTFRGSGDIGASMSAAHGVRMLDPERTLIQFQCVKARDFEAPKPFQLEGRPWIDRKGDFHMVGSPGECGALSSETKKRSDDELSKKILRVVRKTPGLSGNKIAIALGGNRNRVYEVLQKGADDLWKAEQSGSKKEVSYYAID